MHGDSGSQIIAIEPPPPRNSRVITIPTQENDSAALSKGAIAGIAVGAVGILVVTGFAVWYLLRARRRRHQEAEHITSFPEDRKVQGAPNPDMPRDNDAWKAELPSDNNIAEADDTRRDPHELAHQEPLPNELEGDAGKQRPRPGMIELPA